MKVPEGLPRFVSVGSRGLLIPLEKVIGALPRLALPRDGDRRAGRLPASLATATPRSRTTRTTCSIAVEIELQKRRFGAVVRLEVSSSISSAMLKRLEERLPAHPDLVYPIQGLLDLADLSQLYDIDRPDLKYEPWVPYTQRRLANPKDGSLFAEIAHRDIVVQHPYDSFATSVESFVRAAAKDPQGRHAQDDRLPDEPRLGARAGADRGGRERQAERLRRRAEGAFRRAAEHRVGARARRGRRPRRLRLSRPEDPREDDARRPPRGRRASSATCTSAPATTTPRRHACTRTSACSRPIRTSPPTSPTCSTSSRASAGRQSSGRSSSPRSRSAKGSCEHIRAVAEAAAARQARPDPDQGQQPHRPVDRRRALQGIAGRRGDRPDRAGGLHAPAGRPRA